MGEFVSTWELRKAGVLVEQTTDYRRANTYLAACEVNPVLSVSQPFNPCLMLEIPGNRHECSELYNCCDCGDSGCGCRYCYSCNACEACLDESE